MTLFGLINSKCVLRSIGGVTNLQVTVMFAPLLNEEVGMRQCIIEIEKGINLSQVFELLTERYGKVFKDVASAAGRHSGILVLLNNQIVMCMDKQLSDGDEISFAIPLSGG
jgi:molybdopterin converting factor small subunit